MTTYVVWVDADRANLSKIHAEQQEHRILRRTEFKHHTNADPKNHKNSEKFFHQLAGQIKDGEEILLLGPGLAKGHFMEHLRRHHHGDLDRRVVGVETMDHPTDGQILDFSRRFFRVYDTYVNPVS